MQTRRGFIGLMALVAIVLGIMVISGSAYFMMHQNSAPQTLQNHPDISTTQQTQLRVQTTKNVPVVQPPTNAAQPIAQSQLAKDLSNITPQFVDDTKEDSTGRQILPSELEKIKNDVALIRIGPGPYDSNTGPDIFLEAVGKRYVELTITRPTDASSSPQILDSVTLKSNYISGLFQFVIGKTAVYVSATDICTYTLDQPSCVPLPGAKLSGGEVYGDDSGMAGDFAPQDLTHTNTSMTIAVLAWANPYTDRAKLRKVRDVTLAFSGVSLPRSTSGSANTAHDFSVSTTSGKAPLSVTTTSFDACNSQLTWGDTTDTWYSGYAMESCGGGATHPMISLTHTYTAPGSYTISLYLDPTPASPMSTVTIQVTQ